MTTRLRSTLVIALLAAAILGNVVLYSRAEREAARARVTTEVMTAWWHDMTEENKELSRFVPKAREAIGLQRAVLSGDPGAFGSLLWTYGLMSMFSHFNIMSNSEPPASVKAFEIEVVNELADLSLAMIDRHDDRLLAFAGAFTESDVCDLVRDGKCQRILLEGGRMAATLAASGRKGAAKASEDIAGDLNSLAWDVVSVPGKPADEYRLALARAEVAASGDGSNGSILNTLALAQYRAGQIDPAATSVAKAIALREDKVPASDDLVVKAMIDAKAGRGDDSRAALRMLDERRAKAEADAAKRGQKPTVNAIRAGLRAEAERSLEAR
jgi:hypothetical protein